MRTISLTTIAVAVLVYDAAALRVADAGAIPAGLARHTGLRAASVERVANVCGRNGCVPVQTKRVVHQKPGSVSAKHI